MSPFAANLNLIISVFAILAQALVLAVIASVVFKKDWHFTRLAKKHGVLLAFLTALSGTLFSLIYSDIIGFAPCELCIIQRVFLYPQVLILGWLLFKQSVLARKIALWLSIIGAAIGAFHYYGQMFNADALAACETAGISCSKIPFIQFGYITIPMLSITAFVLIIALLLSQRSDSK